MLFTAIIQIIIKHTVDLVEDNNFAREKEYGVRDQDAHEVNKEVKNYQKELVDK